MKTTLKGYVPAKDAPFGSEKPVELEPVNMPMDPNLWVTITIGDTKVNVLARELAAAVGGLEAARVQPNWTLKGLYGPHGTFPIQPHVDVFR
jgi:hypothetical protein